MNANRENNFRPASENPVLITGAAGYIARAVARELTAAGYPLQLTDARTPVSARENFHLLDLTDRTATRTLVARLRPAAIVHLAGLIQVGESVREPELYWRVNVGAGNNLLEAARENGVRALVYSSSAAVYGEPKKIPLDEAQPLAPLSPYGKSKAGVESLLADCEAAGGPRFAALRFFNAAGASADGSDGEDHEPETHLIPSLMRALRADVPVRILGADYPTPDGSGLRDYIHVEDLAAGHRLALEYLLRGGASTILNLGTGVGASVREVIALAEAVSGKTARVEVLPRRPGDCAALVADPALAQKVLGFKTRHDLAAIVRTAWAWEQRNPNPAPQ